MDNPEEHLQMVRVGYAHNQTRTGDRRMDAIEKRNHELVCIPLFIAGEVVGV